MKIKGHLYICIFMSIVFPISANGQSQELRPLIEQGREAYEADDFHKSLALIKQANGVRPNHPMILRLLVRLNALTNQKEAAYAALRTLLMIDADIEILLHQDLQSIQGDKRFKSIQREFEEMNKPVGKYDTVAVITQRKLHPESLVVLPDEGILLGSVHERKIVKVSNEGEVEDWVPSGAHGLYAVMGMKLDQQRGLLWVASTAIPQMVWYTDDMDGKAAVFAFDIHTRKLVKKYEAPSSGEYWFGDLAVAENGAVYISNSRAPEIYTIATLASEVRLWKTIPALVSLQGLALNGDRLFVADYLHGLYVTEASDPTKAPVQVLIPDGVNLKGIDGLYFFDDQLITIQNGVYPNRITSWELSDDQKSIVGFRYLDKANPLFGEPTLGCIEDELFYYIANSQWNGYLPDGTLLDSEQLQDIYILRTTLKPD